MNTLVFFLCFSVFLIIVSIISFLFIINRNKQELELIGRKLDNSDEAIADAMEYFELTNLAELKANDR